MRAASENAAVYDFWLVWRIDLVLVCARAWKDYNALMLTISHTQIPEESKTVSVFHFPVLNFPLSFPSLCGKSES